jgi:Putative DNA-binding domain
MKGNKYMSLNKPLDSITESDLQVLIDTQVAERKNIEYKQSLPKNEEKEKEKSSGKSSIEEKKEFLADVSSLANTAGGHLIFGIKEQNGLPIELCGVQVDNTDAEKLRLESLLQEGLSPRIPRVEIHLVELSSKRAHVFILRVPSSFLSPHRVIYKRHAHFYARSSAGKYQMDVPELRTAFELSGTTAKSIRDFRVERLSKISAREEIPSLLEEQAPTLILHMIPSSAFNPLVSVDIKLLNDYSKWGLMRPLVVWDTQPPTSLRFNLDGIARTAQWTKSAATPTMIPAGYVQVFRNGIVEIVDVTILGINDDKKVLLGEVFEIRLLQAVKLHMELLQFLGVEPPVFIMVSLLGVKGYKINRGASSLNYAGNYTEEIDRTNLIIPEVMIDTFNGGNDHITEVMRPIFDATWNAANHAFSPNYDGEGKYIRGWN